MTIRNIDVASAFSRGFDRGNYGNAYESQDWDSWYAKNCIPKTAPYTDDAHELTTPERDAMRDGMLLGFFSSYELDEIEDCAGSDVACEVAQLRAEYSWE